MNKRFNIRAAFEEAKEAADAAQLEVDKEAALTPEEKALRDSALQLASATDESEGAKPAEDKGTTDTPPVADETPTPTEEPVSTDEVAPVAGEEPEAEEGTDADTDKTEEIEPTPEPTEEPKEGDDAEPTDAPADVDDAPDLDLDNPDDVPVDPESEEGKEKAKDNEEDKEQEKDAVKVAASLESIANIMQRSLDKGGLTPMSAQATALVLGQLYNRVGLTYKPAAFPAMESYGSVSSRKRNTELALENVKQAIGNILSALIQSVLRTAKHVKESMMSIDSVLASNEKTISETRVLVSKGTKDSTEKTFTSNDDIVALSVGNKFDYDLCVKKYSKLSEDIASKVSPNGLKALKLLTELHKAAEEAKDATKMKSLSVPVERVFPYPVTGENYAYDKGAFIYKGKDPLPGGYIFSAIYDDFEFVSERTLREIKFEKEDSSSNPEKVEFIEKSKIIPFLDKLETANKNARSAVKNFYGFYDQLMKTHDILEGSATSDAKEMFQLYLQIERGYVNCGEKLLDYIRKGIRSGINYANTSAKAYI